MAHTDKTRPYLVRCEDPLEPLVWSSTINEWYLGYWVFSPWGHSTKQERRVYGHKPDRQRTRAQLVRARRAANAGEREDLDIFSPQARHSVDWLVS
jgi:hypothetical protein